MVSSIEPDGSLLHRSINACLCPVYAVEGQHVVTVEGLGTVRGGLHPVQERLAKAHGSQCGFCTPGFVMSMYTLLRSKNGAPISEEEIEENLAGNLCRCTGYRPILDAFRPFAKADPAAYTEDALIAARGATAEAPANGNATSNGTNGNEKVAICPSSGKPCTCTGTESDGMIVTSSTDKENGAVGAVIPKPAVAATEPIFPPELRRREVQELEIPGPVATWYRPLSLEKLLSIKAEHPDAKIVVGNSEVGIEMKFKYAQYPVLIGATHVPELNAITVEESGVHFGASLTLTKLLKACHEISGNVAPYRGSALRAVAEQLRWFAGPPIRNGASIGGNVCTASPISDLNPLWMAARAEFTVTSAVGGSRTIPADSFFIGYRKVDLKPDEIFVSVFLPFTRQYEYVKEFKQAHRRDDDIAIVNAGMRFLLAPPSAEGGAWTIAEASVAYGGVAAKTVTAPKVVAVLVGKVLDQSCLPAALAAVAEDVDMAPNAPGGMVEFRRSLAASFLFKGVLFAATSLEGDAPSDSPFVLPFEESYRSAVQPYHRPSPCGLQYFSPAENSEDIIGQPYRHAAADMQVTGEAIYVDDMPLPPGTLHAALVMSSRPHARLLGINSAPALALPGVAGVFSAADLPGRNDIGAVIHDEELFATEKVTCVGQVIAIAVAETEAQARAAARAVIIEYEDLPALLDIDAAVAEKSFIPEWGHAVECGDVDTVLSSSTADGDEVILIEGEVRMGGQEHFYLEPNAHLVVPGENDEIVSYSSTQVRKKKTD